MNNQFILDDADVHQVAQAVAQIIGGSSTSQTQASNPSQWAPHWKDRDRLTKVSSLGSLN